MKIAVLGATGRTGRQVIEQALNRGDEVVAYVRAIREIAESAGLRIAVGQLGEPFALKSAIAGADVVLVCLGTQGKRLTKNVDLMQNNMPLIIKAMKEANVHRLVLLSAYGVGNSARTAGLLARLIYRTLVPAIYKDKECAEALLARSGLSWTLVYPVALTDGPLADAVEVRPMTEVRKVAGLPKVSRADVARIMLDAARDDRSIGQTLLVSSQGTVR